jgi:Ca2+-binding RTX toxin-like protein
MRPFTAAQARFDAEGNLFWRFDRNLVQNGVTGGVLDLFALEDDLSSFTFTILEPTATIVLPVLNDILEEPDRDYTYTLESGEGYQVDPEADMTTFTVTDGVPGGVGPVISVSAAPTTLIESEGTALTVTLTTDDPLPEGGVVVFLDSGVPLSLNEFDFTVNDPRLPEEELIVEGVTTDGGNVAGANEQVSALLFRMTEQTASFTISVLDDGIEEGSETFTYTLRNGEQYEVDPNADSVTITIEDTVEGGQTFFGTTGDDEFDAGVSPDGFSGRNDTVFAGAGDDLIDTSNGSGNNRLYGQSGDDTLFVGSNDRAFGGSGEDVFYLLGGGSTISGGSDADQFWIALGEYPESTNTITDFESGVDVLGIGGLGLSFTDLAITQQGSNALIASSGQEIAKLLGINATSLSADDFTFA